MAAAKNAEKSEPVLIKEYANRQLYNTATSSFVTLDHLCQMVKEGMEFVVYDTKTGANITSSFLNQIIAKEEAHYCSNLTHMREGKSWRILRLRRPIRLARYIGARLAEKSFDLRHGTDTTDRIYAAELGYENEPEFEHYQPITRRWFRRMVAELPLDVRDGVFVDLGSGKGRALMFACQHQFSSVIGVEYSPTLHAIASRNFRHYAPSHLRSGRVRLVQGDAAAFRFPDVATLIIFLYNPFGRTVIDRVIKNLLQWLDVGQRRAVILYRAPVHAAAFAEPPFSLLAIHEGYRCWRVDSV